MRRKSLDWHEVAVSQAEDMLLAIEDDRKRAFDREMDAVKLAVIPSRISVFTAPRCGCNAVDLGRGGPISMAQKKRLTIVGCFRHDGTRINCLGGTKWFTSSATALSPVRPCRFYSAGGSLTMPAGSGGPCPRAGNCELACRDLSLERSI